MDMCVTMGATVVLDCVIDRGGMVSFTWTRNGGPLTSDEAAINGGSSLRLNASTVGMVSYTCTATNAAGSDTATTRITTTGSKFLHNILPCDLLLHLLLLFLLLLFLLLFFLLLFLFLFFLLLLLLLLLLFLLLFFLLLLLFHFLIFVSTNSCFIISQVLLS